jgi:hypothetical protein
MAPIELAECLGVAGGRLEESSSEQEDQSCISLFLEVAPKV